jgi:hypothetical protein
MRRKSFSSSRAQAASKSKPQLSCLASHAHSHSAAQKGGKVRILSDVTAPRQLEDGRTAVQRVQQFHCQKCKCIAKGVKQIGGVAVGGPRLFNRLTGKSQ